MNTPDYSSICSATPSSSPGAQYNKETNECFQLFKAYLLEKHMSELVRILLEEEVNVHYSLKIDGSDLLESCVILTEYLFFQSDKILKLFDRAMHAATCVVYGNHYLKSHMSIKQYLHVRINKLPSCPEIWRDRVPKSIDIGHFLAMEGTIIRTSSAKILEYKKEYMCSKCKNVFSLQADFQLHYVVPAPTSCPVKVECPGKKFVVMAGTDGTTGPKKCKDYQEIRVQEQVRKLSMGTIPRSMTIVLEDDLVDSCKPGDDVVIFGSVACRWHPSTAGKPCDLELVFKANNIEVCNERHSSAKGIDFDELQDEFQCFWAAHGDCSMMARNHILASLCPQVYGLYVVKLAVALVLAGGVPRTDSSGSRVRGECHLLLVGDPGTGKSQFLKYAAKVTPRSVLTTGIGSSTAGLTVSAIRDGPHWTLEAGALVLADSGICCIDEFSGIKEHDRSAIHEAMEQQTISVAKAGLVCKLNTRTSILAATNPKLGKYDESSSVSFNIAMASPLLSRFDLVLVLLDVKNLHWDSVVADYLLMGKDAAEQDNLNKSDLWSLDQMQAYFGIIRKLNPTLSSEADQVLRAYYRCHRQSNSRNAARTTIRLLESLIRLSEAHARFMFRNTVTIQDAVAAVTVMESSMHGGSLLPTGSILHSCFPKDADLEYKKHARLVLQCLNLENLSSDDIQDPPLQSQIPKNTPSISQCPDIGKKPTFQACSQVVGGGNFTVPPNQNRKDDAEISNKFDFFNDFESSLASSISQIDPCSTNQPQKQIFAKPSSTPLKRPLSQPRASLQKFAFKRGIANDGNTKEKSPVQISEPGQASQVKKHKKAAETTESELSDIFCREFFENSDSHDQFSQTAPDIPTSITVHHAPGTNLCQSNPVASPWPSQVSLFSVNALASPKPKSENVTPQRKCQLKFTPKKLPTVADHTERNAFTDILNSSFAFNKPTNIFQLPESEASFMFPEFNITQNRTQNNKNSFVPKIHCTKNVKNKSFAFTLDPSTVEDICSDLDFLS